MYAHLINIALVDDHWAVRDGYRNVLKKLKYITSVKTFAGSKEMFTEMDKSPFDLILLDIQLKNENGLDVCKVLKNRFKNIKVLMVSAFDNPGYILNAYQNNADGYLLKDCDLAELKFAIDQIMYQNEKYYTAFAAKIIFNQQESAKKRHLHSKTELTGREIEVMLLICDGETDKRISMILYIDESTAAKHRHNILKKINGHKSIEIILYAIKNGMYTIIKK